MRDSIVKNAPIDSYSKKNCLNILPSITVKFNVKFAVKQYKVKENYNSILMLSITKSKTTNVTFVENLLHSKLFFKSIKKSTMKKDIDFSVQVVTKLWLIL